MTTPASWALFDTVIISMVRHYNMDGYINSGFTNTITSLSLNTKNIVNNTEEHDERDTTDLNDDSFLSDLERDSGRGYNEEYESDAPVLHGYCDRSFEKNILTFTNGDTGTQQNTTSELTVETHHNTPPSRQGW